MIPADNDRLMLAGEVGKLFRVDRKTVIRWGEMGKLGRVLVTPGGHRRYRESAVRALLDGSQDDLHE